MLHKKMPDNFSKQFDVVACYVEHAGRFLMLKRCSDKPNGSLWGLPAGKVDAGEALKEALCRELLEETGIDCLPESFLDTNAFYVTHGQIDFVYHTARLVFDRLPEVTVNSVEHDEFLWVTPLDSLNLKQVPDQKDCTREMYELP